MTLKPVALYLVMAGSAVATLGTGLALERLAPGATWHQPQVHSAAEALGGLAAIAMAVVLFQRRAEPGGGKLRALTLGFLGMGLLEAFHAVAPPGDGFILLRGAASLVGGIGFALVWLPESAPILAHDCRPAWGVAAGAVAVGLWVLASPGALPAMTRGGQFTPTAVAPTSLACCLFLLASARLLLDHRESAKPEAALLACLALLFALAEFMFMYSALWDARWWFWHGLRLLAYLLVLGYVARGYLRIVSDLRRALAQTRLAEETLRANERDLRRLFEAREQMARDLHDGILQSIYAQVLGLERCLRLVGSNPEEATRQLAVATAELRLVIRELRRYLQGLEPPPATSRDLEATLAALVRSLEGARALRMTLRVDPAAADQLTPEQATHLVYIAREALSNSLRHAQARTAAIALDRAEGAVRLTVEDDGLGFEPSDTAERGHGLKNMAARARMIGAQFTVASKPGRGTRVRFEIPMERAHASP